MAVPRPSSSEEHHRRRRDAHEQAASTHEEASVAHEKAAALFARHGRPDQAERELRLAQEESDRAGEEWERSQSE